MRIAIIGSGSVGSALGRTWSGVGHDVVFGVRNPDAPKMATLVTETGGSAADMAHACENADVVVLAVPWSAVRDVVAAAGDLSGKVLFDCTNPLIGDLSGLEIGQSSSGGERLAEWAPGARVVKIFNTVGSNVMADPHFGEERATMIYCGDDAGAKAVGDRLARDAGFDPLDAGPLSYSRLLEPVALLWIRLAIDGRDREFAFKLMRR